MAGGPITPISVFPVTTSRVFPNFHVGAGSGSKRDNGLGVEASVGADSTWELRFKIPEVLPTGTAKLILWALANATSGVAKVDPQYAMVATEEDPSSAILVPLGTQTLTWGSGDADQYKELNITLESVTDAAAPVAGEMLVMDLVFETASWTLAAVSTWYAWIIWE